MDQRQGSERSRGSRQLPMQPMLWAAMTMMIAGCASAPTSLYKNASRPYPIEMDKQSTLPIQVIRETTKIELTNTTPHEFGKSTIWLNSRFSHDIDQLGIGETITLPLTEFTDEFGEHFRAGGFFATVDPDPLVMCEIETKGELHGLVVVGNPYE